MAQGKVVSIHITEGPEAAMESVAEVKAVPGKGLEGDRYFRNIGSFSGNRGTGRDLTMIETEAVEAFASEYGVSIEPGDARRNIVTEGVALNDLVGREFKVGEVTVRGVRLCEPCAHLATLTHEKVLPGLVHRAGLRCDILSGGVIRLGDVVQIA